AETTDQNTNSASQTDQSADTYAKAPAGAVPEHYKGSPTSSVLVEEFADFQCPACAEMHKVVNEINAAYGSRIKFVFRNYPLIQVHPKAYDAAVAAEAAGLQGKFWEMQNMLFTNQQTWSTDPNHRKIFEEYAKTIGLDVEKFTNDSLGLNAKSRVDADMQRGNGVGIRSTPTIFVNGKSLTFEQSTVEGIKAAVDAELKKSGAESAEEKPEAEGNNNAAPGDQKKDEKPSEGESNSESNTEKK
ncbi:MAG: thioredoxin domain-containing protein, partial [Acidobacteria bacterium]|nr:thioredoxin domain-containing protein [Acidobacteriota bacterium]